MVATMHTNTTPRAYVIAAALATGGCYTGLASGPGGDVDDDSVQEDGDDDGDSDGDPSVTCEGAHDEPDLLRRLTSTQIVATVEAIVGTPMPADVRAWLPDDMPDEGFSNDAAHLVVQPAHTEGMLHVAEWAAEAMLGDPEHLHDRLGCEPSASTCLRAFINRFGRLAYRRALLDAETDRIETLARAMADAADPMSPFARAIEAMLQSPKFLLRPEIGTPHGEGRMRLTGTELAGRLAFGLWGQAPDDALLSRAELGELDDPDGIRSVAAEMLEDPRARRGLAELGSEWFLLPKLDIAQVDHSRFPRFTPSLRGAMREELERLIDDHMFGDVSFFELYTAPYGYVTPELANLYGVAYPSAFASSNDGVSALRVDLPPETARGGLFATAGFLTMGAQSWFASPVRRGLNVRVAALCNPPPAPPPDVEMNDLDGDLDPVDAFDKHSSDPACAACHSLLDPIGWGLDRYDTIGSLRAVNESGEPVREDGWVAGLEPGEFSDAYELGRLVAGSDRARTCAVEQTVRWMFARRSGEATHCALTGIEAAFTDSGFRYRELVLALVTSEPFTIRTIGEAGAE